MSLNKQLLEILACPACLSPVEEQGEFLACKKKECGKRYPVRGGIPVMIIEEAVS